MGKGLENTLKFFKQAPDANVAVGLALGLAFVPGTVGKAASAFAGLVALKQYAWGQESYEKARDYIIRKVRDYEAPNFEAIKKTLRAPCQQCGVNYAIKQYKENPELFA